MAYAYPFSCSLFWCGLIMDSLWINVIHLPSVFKFRTESLLHYQSYECLSANEVMPIFFFLVSVLNCRRIKCIMLHHIYQCVSYTMESVCQNPHYFLTRCPLANCVWWVYTVALSPVCSCLSQLMLQAHLRAHETKMNVPGLNAVGIAPAIFICLAQIAQANMKFRSTKPLFMILVMRGDGQYSHGHHPSMFYVKSYIMN